MDTPPSRPADVRITAYQFTKRVLLVVLCGLIVKFAFCDTVAVRTDQMQPAILTGDRLCINKAVMHPPGSWLAPVHTGDVVCYRPYTHKESFRALRIAAMSGDAVVISDGILTLANRETDAFLPRLPDNHDPLPSSYAPRDNFSPWILPSPGDTYSVDTLPLRARVFLYQVICQENPRKRYSLRPQILMNGVEQDTFTIHNFALYEGPLHGIPDSSATRWFFWDRLAHFLSVIYPDSTPRLTLDIMHDSTIIREYTVTDTYFFGISDNWVAGYDSRHTGPIGMRTVVGRVSCILWSFTPGTRFGLRGSRLFKFLQTRRKTTSSSG